jgi:integrase
MTAAEIDRTDPTLWVHRPKRHKNAHRGKKRTIYLGPKSIEILRRYLLKAGEAGKLFPITRNALRRAVSRGCLRAFPHPTISKIKPSTRTPEQKAELKEWHNAHEWHPNQLRHTFATEVRRTPGAGGEAAQVLLGHEEFSTTEIYAEPNDELGRDVARKIG